MMNFWAFSVMTTWTSTSALTKSLTNSAALYAAIPPVTPKTTFFILSMDILYHKEGRNSIFYNLSCQGSTREPFSPSFTYLSLAHNPKGLGHFWPIVDQSNFYRL